MAELSIVTCCTGVKWHIGGSHYSQTVVWRRAVSKDEVSLDEKSLSHLKSMWSRKAGETGVLLTPCLPLYMVGVLKAERQGWGCVGAVHGKTRSANRCGHLCSMTLALCICDLKLPWLLLQLSCLACHLENIYFCPLYLKKKNPPDKIWLVTGVAASVWEADLYCSSTSCGLQSSLKWPTKDAMPKWHHGMIRTSHLHMQCRFISSGLTNTDSKNRPVAEKRLDVLSLFKSLVFLQIKASLHG